MTIAKRQATGKHLTEREYAILEAVCVHTTQAQAAKSLGIATSTLKNHLVAVRKKVGGLSVVQLAYQLGAGDLDAYLPGAGDPEEELA